VREITLDDVEDLALGAVVLGTGGGGEPYVPTLMVREALRTHGPVPVVRPDELDPEGLVLPLGIIGAPTAAAEKLFNGGESRAALRTLEDCLGRKGVAVMPIEVGGGATLLPIAAAAELGLPVVDADSMRRAFPKAELTLLNLAGISASPLVLVDAENNTVVVHGIDTPAVERLARPVVVEMGMIAICAAYALTGAQVNEFAIHGSLTYCIELGRRMRAIREGDADAYPQLLEFTGGRLIFTGKVADIERRTVNAWAVGTLTLEHLQDPDRVLRIDFQNENLIAMEAGVPLVTVPDLISLLDAETGTPMTTEALRYGQRLQVLATPAHERWHQPDGIALAGPRSFGYDLDYVPFGGTR
jgi:uncharacterized protein